MRAPRAFVSVSSLAAALTVGFAVSACSPSSSASAAAGVDASAADAGSVTYGTSACGACRAKACAPQVAACNSDPDCAAYLSCIDACGVGSDGDVDAPCAAMCPTGSSSSAATAEQGLTDCDSASAGACGACGGDGGAEGGNPILHQTCTPMNDQTACYRCEDDDCCTTYANCHDNADCYNLFTCVVDCQSGVGDDAGSPQGGANDGGPCTDVVCWSTCNSLCAQKHPNGLADWAPKEACLAMRCAQQCQSPPPSASAECLIQLCAEEYVDLAGTADGYLYLQCFYICNQDMTCIDACGAQYPSVAPAASAFAQCSLGCP